MEAKNQRKVVKIVTKVTKVTLAVVWREARRELLAVLGDSTYRSNVKFCSRTHSFGQTSDPVNDQNMS